MFNTDSPINTRKKAATDNQYVAASFSEIFMYELELRFYAA